MEWERMGFDLSLLGYSVLAIAFLIATGVAFVANVTRFLMILFGITLLRNIGILRKEVDSE